MRSRAERNVHDPENAINQVVAEDIVIEVLGFPSIFTGVPVTSVQRIADTLASP